LILFFTSLATDRGEKAIGVILSGTVDDGVIGIKASHKAGGMVIVQDPATAKFKRFRLLHNLLAADWVLSPKGMRCNGKYVRATT
jgi:two-component system CheB/CheR fusion protein